MLAYELMLTYVIGFNVNPEVPCKRREKMFSMICISLQSAVSKCIHHSFYLNVSRSKWTDSLQPFHSL